MEREPLEERPEAQPLPRQGALFAADFTATDELRPPEGEDTVVPLPPAAPRPPSRGDVDVRNEPVPALPPSLSVGPTQIPASARLYLTADLRAATGLSRTATDFYLRAGVLRPTARAESGYLLFDERELTVLRRVLDWRARGIGLREIKARLGR